MIKATDWITNSPEAAAKLRAADREFEAAIDRARLSVALSDKIQAIRTAREDKAKAYKEAAQ